MRVLNLPKSPIKPMGLNHPRYHILVVRQGESNRPVCMMLNQKLDTQILSVSGHCHCQIGRASCRERV